MHRGQLEHVIRQQLFSDYLKTLNYISLDELKFYTFFLKRMEIDQILSCVRYLVTDNTGEYFFSLPSSFEKHTKLDLHSLAKVKSYDELLNLLSKTPYHSILKEFDPKAENKTDIIMIESEFDRYFYSYVFSVIDKEFSAPVANKIRSSFGVDVDMKNITEIIRLKKYFNVKSDQIKPLLLPWYYRIKKVDLTRMTEAPDVDTAMQVLADTGYAKFYEHGKYDYIERLSQQIKYEHNKSLLAFSDSASVSVVAYLQLKKLEIDNIIGVIEGVRYGLNPAEISNVLVGSAD